MKQFQASFLAVTLCLAITGCSTGPRHVQHYVSGTVQGEAAKINLEEVQKAFWETKGKDFDTSMTAFEKRVNEIYDGTGVVSIDATKDTGKLTVTGYIDTNKTAGFQTGDEKLFAIEQTGDPVDDKVPYRVANGDGQTYYQGHHSLLDSPMVQMLVLSHLIGGGGFGGGWGGRYYTPRDRVVVLDNHRTAYRTTPQYSQQKASNSGFMSRFKTSTNGAVQSTKTGFGSGFSSDSTQRRRSWGSSSPSTSSGSGWGGRRGSFGGGSRGWGGRRR